MLNKVHQEAETSMKTKKGQYQRFGTVRIKYTNFDSIKSVSSTKLESSTGKG